MACMSAIRTQGNLSISLHYFCKDTAVLHNIPFYGKLWPLMITAIACWGFSNAFFFFLPQMFNSWCQSWLALQKKYKKTRLLISTDIPIPSRRTFQEETTTRLNVVITPHCSSNISSTSSMLEKAYTVLILHLSW